MGPESVETFNQRIAQHPRFPGIEHLSKGVIRLKQDPKVQAPVVTTLKEELCADYLQTCRNLAVHSLTGGLMESFLQIAETTLDGLVSPAELTCFSHHVDIIACMLHTRHFTEAQLQELDRRIVEWKAEFVGLYSNVVEHVRGGGCHPPYSAFHT